MKTRLGIFVAAIVLLPLLGFFVSGMEWDDLTQRHLVGDASIVNLPATLLTTLMMAGYILFINHLNKLITGNQPFKEQQKFLLWVGAAGAVLCWLTTYLNLYAATWATQADNPLMQALLYTPLFALLAPAVLSTRAFIAALPGVLKIMRTQHSCPPPAPETLSLTLLALAILGLTGGVTWIAHLALLFWLAPLLLLMGLQLLWNENTVFSGLKTGDNGRLICAGLAGLVTGNFTLFAYHSNGGVLAIQSTLLQQVGFIIFGLTCMQLADVVAENWRGKKRSELFQQKKKFPIPVVVKSK